MTQVRIVVTIDATDDTQAEAIAEALKAECRAKATEPGALQFEVFRSLLNSTRLVVHELWESFELFDTHWASVIETEGAPQGIDGKFPKCEFYQHIVYVIRDGVWEPKDSDQRSLAVRWS